MTIVSDLPASNEVDVLVDRLRAEHARTGALETDQVLRICERRGVPQHVASSVRDRLISEGLLQGTRRASTVRGWMPPDEDEGLTGSPIDLMGEYLQDVGRHALLMAEDEVVLGRRIRAARERLVGITNELTADERERLGFGDPEKQFLRQPARRLDLSPADRRVLLDGADAEDRLYVCNLRLVVSIAKKLNWHHSKLDPLDVIQAGNEGLVRAVQKFDHTKGYKFSTYATWWIRQSITRQLANEGRTIRLPVHFHDNLRHVLAARRHLSNDLGREPTLHELSDHVDLSAGVVQAMLEWTQDVGSLDVPVGGGALTIGELVPAQVADTATAAEESLQTEAVWQALDELNEREQQVMVLRYGLEDGQTRTLEEVGQKFGVTRERIRQIESKALAKLRHPHRSVKLREYLD